ncbi:HD domain-containing protein [Vulcanisaeta thermophila]|uniref:HD domain-containing protein n=1 Tax=Vulcanisaeta thermophila TaxID=867917 RepID=UPI0008530B06|nr:HD domain-containing protein [Vulcanisaeta thermophila]
MQLNYTKVIADPVFGWVRITDDEAKLIDSSEHIQRLRYVRQLGFTYMVYPLGTYTRFEHSLGVMQLATLMFNKLFQMDYVRSELKPLMKDLGIDDEGTLLEHVRLAGLFHDLGHMPFSHVFEGVVGPNVDYLINKCSVNDDDRVSGRMLKLPFKEHEVITYLLLNNNDELKGKIRESLGYVDLRIIRLLLHGDIIGRLNTIEALRDLVSWEDRKYLSEVGEGIKLINFLRMLISSDLDADRFDYILRDLYTTGASIGFYISLSDVERILDNLRVLVNNGNYELAIDEKARANVEGFVIARYNIYKWVYLHHKVILITTLAKLLMSELLTNMDKLNDELVDYLCTFYKFMIGRLSGVEVLKITDPYLMSLLIRNRNFLVGVIRGIENYLDPILLRNTNYKALWKRDSEFLTVIRNSKADLDVINNRFVNLLNTGTERAVVMKLFYSKLTEKLRNSHSKCGERIVGEGMVDSRYVILGYRAFGPSINVKLSRGNEVFNLNEISPLVKSVESAWMQSPHLFAYVNVNAIRERCSEDSDEFIEYLKGVIISVIKEVTEELSDLVKSKIESNIINPL